MNKKVIFAISAVLILALGIGIGLIFSKSSSEESLSTTASEDNNEDKKTNREPKNTEPISEKKESSNENTGITADNQDIKASDIGQPIMPEDKSEESVNDDVSNISTGEDLPGSSDNDPGKNQVKEDENKPEISDNENMGGTSGKEPKNDINDKPEVSNNDSNQDEPENKPQNNNESYQDEPEKEPVKDTNVKDEAAKEPAKDNNDKNEPAKEPANDNNVKDEPAKEPLKDNNGKDEPAKDPVSDNNGNDEPAKDPVNDNNDKDEPTKDPVKDNNDKDEPTKEPAQEDKDKPSTNVIIAKPVSVIDTGNLSEKGSGYEGTKGTGNYNYGEALQKSILFYELQRSGKLPEKVRCNWRGDSCLNDGQDNGLDLTGGWFDAGDNVKFNLPMAYTASMLGWSIIDDADAYEKSGQLSYALGNIKWVNDYFIKCHPSDKEYYYQVGDGNQDHSYWGAAETVEYRMNRPSYKVTESDPGSAVCGETAASLAICSIIYQNIDKSYSDLCLKHAKSLYKFARDTKSDAGYTAANGFYNSWSGFYDELAWSGAWLYCATGDKSYISNAEEDYKNAGHDYDWAMCWDDVHIGAALMLAKLTKKDIYRNEVEHHLDWWTGLSSEHITYSPKGLAWLDSWGSLRYATTTSFIALSYVESGVCPKGKVKAYTEFAEKQADYALGSSGRSFMVGFGDNSPKNPHHRTAQGSYCDNMNEPSEARHTLYGALVGGPDANDGYTDTVSDYNKNEVACDYNAGFTGLLAKMYKKYHGQTLKNFGAVEKINTDEFYVKGGINVDGEDFIEIKALICNVSAWPARGGEKLEYRYYVDLSEVYDAGGNASDIAVTTNYMAAGKSAGLKVWDEDKHIYYLSVDFSDSVIYPGGQDKYKKEIQVRIRNQKGTWDNSNDPSFSGMTKGGEAMLTASALYENGKLIFGTEPAKGKNAGKTITVQDGSGKDNGKKETENNKDNDGNNKENKEEKEKVDIKGTANNESVSVSIEYDNTSSSSSGISGRLNIVNNSDGTLSLKDLKILFYFTNEDGKQLTFECYHTCISGASGSYNQLTGCSGAFSKAKGKNSDTVCEISYSDKAVLEVGDTLSCNFAIHHSDWSNMNLTNDHSILKADNIVITNKKKQIFGKKPE